MDTVRVLRIIEYVGDRKDVEDVVARSIQGEKRVKDGLIIKAATIGTYPEILDQLVEKENKDE